jgi:hypothetical protein
LSNDQLSLTPTACAPIAANNYEERMLFGDQSKIVANDIFSRIEQVVKWDFSTNIVIAGLNLHTLIKLHFHTGTCKY